MTDLVSGVSNIIPSEKQPDELSWFDPLAVADYLENNYFVKNTELPNAGDHVVIPSTVYNKIMQQVVNTLRDSANAGQMFGLNKSSSLLNIADAMKAASIESSLPSKLSGYLSGNFAGIMIATAVVVYKNQGNQEAMINDLEKVLPAALGKVRTSS